MTAAEVFEARFWAKVDPCRTDGCWEWVAAKNQYGYGIFEVDGKALLAHQFLIGKSPLGDWDHLCRNRACVLPEHLEAVTRKENARRGLKGILKTHCAKGHPWVPENMYVSRKTGYRDCLLCRRDRDLHRRARAAA